MCPTNIVSLGVSTSATNPLANFIDMEPQDSDVNLTKISDPQPRGMFEAAKKVEAEVDPSWFMPEDVNSD